MSKTNYENVTKDVCKYFSQRIDKAHSCGINDIIIDPGFGFSKTTQQNYELLNNLKFFKEFQRPYYFGRTMNSWQRRNVSEKIKKYLYYNWKYYN